LFITFEGLEGSGKTTQIERLARRLEASGAEVVVTREPGATELGSALRALLLRPTNTPMSPAAELLLYVADRAEHLFQLVEPALARGAIVLCDRYSDATLAYQGRGRGLGPDRVRELHRWPPLDRRPHRTLLFEIDAAMALARARSRDAQAGRDEEEGRFEQERLAFHRRVAAGYRELAAAEPERIRVIDARGDVLDVERRTLDALVDLGAAFRAG
jgi:dTMP kinase